MARDPDEDALSWGDRDDVTDVSSVPAQGSDDLARAFPDASPHEGDPDEPTDSDGPGGQLSATALIALGFVGGIYLLYTVGWLVSVLRIGVPFGGDMVLQRLAYVVGEALAVAAAPLWFATTVVLTRSSIIRRGLVWLVVGVVVLTPWPFILGV